MRRTTTATLLTMGLLGAACGGGGSTNPPPPPPPPPPPGSPVMTKGSPSGDAQQGPVGTVLTDPLRVSITQNGTALAGRTVNWDIAPPNGSVTASSVTGQDGIASATVTLPQFAVTSTITATSSGVTNSPLSFSAISTGVGLAVTVNVVNNQFQPAQFQLKQGGTVSFVWGTGSSNHTVTPVAPNTIPASTPAGGTHSAPFSFEVTFPAQGVFTFFCEVHGTQNSGMRGTITVVP